MYPVGFLFSTDGHCNADRSILSIIVCCGHLPILFVNKGVSDTTTELKAFNELEFVG
jgi:hypothetical protein